MVHARISVKHLHLRKDPKFAEKVAPWVKTSDLDESIQHVAESEPVAMTTASQAVVVINTKAEQCTQSSLIQ